MTYKILQGDNRETLKTIPDNSIDAIVTDPPYGISFLGKDWDSFRNSKVTKNSTVKNLGSGMRMTTKDENVNFQLWCEDWARECFRVLKPGGYMLSFCAARMYHRMTVGLEDAGFEIRDQIMWIYSSGFPKSQDVGRQLHKKQYGKPDKQRFDPAIMIKVDKDQYRHPDTDKIYRALPDINGDRLAVAHEGQKYGTVYEEVITVESEWSGWGTALKPAHEPIALARKPLKGAIRDNVLKHGTGAINIDATRIEERFPSNVIGEILEEDYQKYFYCPKVSRAERHMGFDTTKIPKNPDGMWDDGVQFQEKKQNITTEKGNNHPTVKPVELMKYLIKLITPPGGTVLDPFNGSGSTGMAAVELGFDYIGCELDPAYVDIALKRIAAWLKKDQVEPADNNFNNLFEEDTSESTK